jgi:predicted PurR-regulated permease PerM
MLKPVSISKINNILIFLILITVVLYFGRQILVLVTFAGFLAILMTPLSNRLENLKTPRVFSSLVSVLIILIVISGVLTLLSAQIANIIQDFPQIKSGLQELAVDIRIWISRYLGISFEEQKTTLKEQASGAVGSAGSVIAGMVLGTFTFAGSFLLVLVFTFLFLLHREKYEKFLIMLYTNEKRNEARELIKKVSTVAQQYLIGRLIIIVIIAILFIIGFLIINLKNAVLLSVITAVANIIPYIGTLLGGIIPLIMVVLFGTPNQIFWVVVIVLIVNFIDNNILEPVIAGGSVNISPFFTIIILIQGYVLWGIAGTILFLPLFGILTIIFKNVEGLQPYDYLLGDQKDSSKKDKISKIKGWASRKKS